MMRARIVHHSEYLALALLLIGAAVWQKLLAQLHAAGGLVDRLMGFGLRGDDGGQALI
jgi:hypothetical protein